jgi:crotonobetainyl-CoA:carnitine CoA-transferase CaiB-like acyl-CoA transferase
MTMAHILDGLSVVDLSSGSAGPIATMLLADAGAAVVRVVAPGNDALRSPASLVWDRGKRTTTFDLRSDQGRQALESRLDTADVLVDSFAPATLERLGLADVVDHHTHLVHCSITGYGRTGALAHRPGYDALVQARTGVMYEQPGHRDGPIFHWAPIPSYGAALLAACGIVAALRERECSGLGQRVETSLLQGVLAFTTMPWTRVANPSPGYYATYGCRDVFPTPCYQAGDGRWIHPMPDAVAAVLDVLGLEPSALAGKSSGSCDERKAFQASVQDLLLQKSSKEWLEVFWERDIRCQPVQSIAQAYEHPQLLHNRAVIDVDMPAGRVRQLGEAVRVTPQEGVPTTPRRGGRLVAPLEGIRVLDFGLAVAGPYAPMLLSDLGADVIRVDNVNAPRATDNQVWAACQRGKRSITLDLKSREGREIVGRLVAGADVIHHNMRPGVAERLGIGYDDVRAVNPGIVYCHVTGFGPTGPLASFPGSDQMSQALSGLEYEQGATDAGGHPTWNRLGYGDHTAAILSMLGVLQALLRRERTGEGALVEANITNAAAFLTSHVALGDGVERWPKLDRDQTGLGPFYRLYRTADDGWLCLAAVRPEHRARLGEIIGRPELADDELGAVLGDAFASRSASEWVEQLDGVGVPAEVASDDFIGSWFDDRDLCRQGLVSKYEHPAWGRTEQLGLLWHLSATPARLFGPPVIHGQHSREILTELGYDAETIEALASAGVTTLPDLAR